MAQMPSRHKTSAEAPSEVFVAPGCSSNSRAGLTCFLQSKEGFCQSKEVFDEG
jgi:hypothetical protein